MNQAERPQASREASRRPLVVGLDAVICAVTEEIPRVLTVRRTSHELAPRPDPDGRVPESLPFGPLDPDQALTLERSVRHWVREQTGLELGYVEQLYTFGDPRRDPAQSEESPRVLSITYLALVAERRPAGTGEATWREWYGFLPWEDWRHGRPAAISEVIEPALREWAASAGDGATRRAREERVEITFGFGASRWDPERVLERYELLFEAGLVEEAHRGWDAPSQGRLAPGRPMAGDHRRILATGLGRLRGKIKYRPVVFELLPEQFTLFQLQRVVEALSGQRLHKQNFRRLVMQAGLVEVTGGVATGTGGRPARLMRFRREVLRERPAPGVGLPGSGSSS